MSDEKEYLTQLFHVMQRRLREYELQAARFGLHTPPYINMEIQDLQHRIEEVGNQLAKHSWQSQISVPFELRLEDHMFVDRDEIMQVIERTALTDRAVCIYGASGVGKTFLINKLARQIYTNNLSSFPDGVIWSNLEGMPTVETAIQQLLADFGMSSPQSDLWQAVGRVLTSRRAIWVLDGAQQSVHGKNLRKLVSMRGSCILMITSRDSEIVDFHKFELQALSSEHALHLFQILSSRFSDDDAQQAAAICQYLGHLPLAIRIAARWSAERANSHKRLSQLMSKFKDIVHSAEINASFAISWADLESEQLRYCFACASVFVGEDWNIIAHASTMQLDLKETEKLIDNLINRCLLNHGRTENRYAIHPLLHEFARVKLGNDMNPFWNVAAYYQTLVIESYHEFYSPTLVDTTRRLTLELGNLQGVWRFCSESGSVKGIEIIGDLLANLWEFLLSRGHTDYAQDLFNYAEDIANQFNNIFIFAELDYGKAMLAMTKGNTSYARSSLQNAERKFHQLQNLRRQIDVQCDLAYLYLGLGDIVRALHCADTVEEIAGKATDPRDLGKAITIKGTVLSARGLWVEALQQYEQALAQFRSVGDLHDIASVLREIGNLYLLKNEPELALVYLAENLDIVESIQHLDMASFTLYIMGNAYIQMHHYNEAEALFNRANTLAQQIGNAWILGAIACSMAELSIVREKFDTAIDYYRHAISYADQVDSPDKKAIVFRGMSETFWQRGQISEALKYSRQALSMQSSLKSKDETLFAMAYMLTTTQTINIVRIKRVVKELLLDEKERARFLVILAKLLRDKRPNIITRISEILGEIDAPFRIEDLYKSKRYRKKYAHLDTIGKLLVALLLQTADTSKTMNIRITLFLIDKGYWPFDVKISDTLRYASTKRWGGGGGCFPAGTQIRLFDHNNSIETLNIDDIVLCRDMQRDMLKTSAIQHIYYGRAEEYYIINNRLRVTGTHSLYTDRGWLTPPQIWEGDMLYNTHHETIIVASIECVIDDINIYNIHLEQIHTFFADDILVHNPKSHSPG